MNEKFGVEVNLNIENFKKKAQELKAEAKIMSDDLKAKTNIVPKVEPKVEIDYNTLNNDIKNIKIKIDSLTKEDKDKLVLDLGLSNYNELKAKLNKLIDDCEYAKDILNYFNQFPIASKWNVKNIENAKNKLFECKNQIDVMNTSLAKFNDNLEDTGDKANKANKSIKKIDIAKSIDKTTNKFKKLAMSLFGIRSIYAMLSRASSAYLSTDESRANKLQSIWAGLGAMLVPVIDKITNAFMKLVGYVNVFVTALTGTNFIAKASTNYMNNLNNSAKETSKTLASFDEINDIGNNASNSEQNIKNPYANFDSVKLDDKLVEKLKALAGWLKENWNWIKLVGEALLLTFGAVKIGKIVSNISGLTSSLGLGSGLLGILQSIAGIGAITIIIGIGGKIWKEMKEIDDWRKNFINVNHKAQEQWLKSETDLNKVYDTMLVNTTTIKDGLYQALMPWNIITGLSSQYKDNAQQALINVKMQVETLRNRLTTEELSNEEKEEMLKKLIQEQEMLKTVEGYLDFFHEDMSNLNEANVEICDTSYEIIENLKQQGISYDEIKEKLNLTEEQMQDIYKIAQSPFRIQVDADVSKARDKVLSLGEGMANLGLNVSNAALNIIRNLPKYDVGTNYVPNDQIAMVHKGEAIIPKRFNSNRYFNNNQDVIYKLDELIETLENKDMNTYITRDEIGKASQKYLNHKTRILGKAVV